MSAWAFCFKCAEWDLSALDFSGSRLLDLLLVFFQPASGE
jgi:hypothetical protein